MHRPSYPRPQSIPGRIGLHTPQEFIPIDTSSDYGSQPSLPFPPRIFPDASWILSTHLVPAALPRTVPDIPQVVLPAWPADKAKRGEMAKKIEDQLVATRQKQWSGELQGPRSRKPLWVSLSRYRRKDVSPKDGRKGVTLFLVHANGFLKEIWEPVLLQLFRQREATGSSYQIAEIWAWEAVNHGDSALINEGNLNGIFDWQDNCRDMLQFLLHYLPPRASALDLPVHLPQLPDSVAQGRKAHGFAERTIIGIGHSYGGATLVRTAIAEQTLFDALLPIDPIIWPYPRDGLLIGPPTLAYALGALQRQTRWASREEACKRLRVTGYFKLWDQATLDTFVECALVDSEDGGVRLKTPSIQEALTFTEGRVMYDTWELLDTLNARVALLWILAGRDPDVETHQQLAWRRPENSRNVIIPGAGHVIPQEAPEQVAEELNRFMQQRYAAREARL